MHVAHWVRTPCISFVDTPFQHVWNIKDENEPKAFKEGTLGSVIVGPILYSDMLADNIKLLRNGGTLLCATPDKKQFERLKSVARIQMWEDNGITIIKKLTGKNGLDTSTPKTYDPEKEVVFILRSGANGDQLMMTPVVQNFYEQGKQIVYYTDNPLMWKGDPRLTELRHIPKELFSLEKFFEVLVPFLKEKHGDKLYNFVQSVEVTLLAGEKQKEFNLSKFDRIARGGKEYFKHHFDYVGLPVPANTMPNIYISKKEREWAENEVQKVRLKTGRSKVVLWNIFGSSFHKMYPWMFDVWKLFEDSDVAFITIGDSFGGFAVGQEFRKYVINYAGMGIQLRHSLALHSVVDATVTPETWSLTAAFAFDAPVVALLSHSGSYSFPFREKDKPLMANVPCQPCYQMHFSRHTCPKGKIEPAAVLCMDQLDPKKIHQALKEIFDGNNADSVAGCDQKVS